MATRASRSKRAASADADAGATSFEDTHRTSVVKLLADGVDEQRSRPVGEANVLQAFGAAGALPPPYDPAELIRWYELSHALRPNIAAYVTNIDGHGHRLTPSVDLSSETIDETVADILYARRLSDAGGSPVGGDDALESTPEQIAAEKERLQKLARREKAFLDSFFESACAETSFVRLRRRTREDLEITGNAYWEVLRNRRGVPARFVYVPSAMTRLMPLDPQFVEVTEYERVTPVDLEPVKVRRRMRRYVQLTEHTLEATYFKEFGDPRTVSSKTGQIYDSPAALDAAEPGARAATEILHFKIDWPASPYGVPRWVGAYPEIGGSRAASEVNYLYFDNKAVPPMMLLVAGKLARGAPDRIKTHIEEKIKGRQNFNSILVVEADSDGKSGGQARLQAVPLNDANQKDGLFQVYDRNNIDKIGAQFRLPGLLRGDTHDLNRATADAALKLAEEQVFAPERTDFDWIINHRLLPVLGIRFWRFQSLTPITKDPEQLGRLIVMLVQCGVLLPQEGRRLAVDVFNIEFPDIKEPWARRPMPLSLAGVQTGGEIDGSLRSGADGSAADTSGVAVDPGTAEPSPELMQQAKALLRLADAIESERADLAKRRMEMARSMAGAGAPPEIEVMKVSRAEFDSWFEPVGSAA